MISSDNVAKLEREIAVQNGFVSNMKDSQTDYEEIMLDMNTTMDAMLNTLLHMRHQLTDSHRRITLLDEENVRLTTLYESDNNTLKTINPTPLNDSTLNGTSHSNTSNGPPSINLNRNKRPHPSNRTTPSSESIALISTSV